MVVAAKVAVKLVGRGVFKAPRAEQEASPAEFVVAEQDGPPLLEAKLIVWPDMAALVTLEVSVADMVRDSKTSTAVTVVGWAARAVAAWVTVRVPAT